MRNKNLDSFAVRQKAMALRCILTCEHATNRIPSEYRRLFQSHREILKTHRGYDPGAEAIAHQFERFLRAPLYVGESSRLLVELNRSVGHPQLFSEFSRTLDIRTQSRVLDDYYHPFRRRVQNHIARWTRDQHRVIHLSLHTFTPSLHGEIRNADIGLLYDPRRQHEKALCCHWQRRIASVAAQLRVRRNYPYQGKSDGFTTALRRTFPESLYLGVELEVNQKWIRSSSLWRQIGQRLSETFSETMSDLG